MKEKIIDFILIHPNHLRWTIFNNYMLFGWEAPKGLNLLDKIRYYLLEVLR